MLWSSKKQCGFDVSPLAGPEASPGLYPSDLSEFYGIGADMGRIILPETLLSIGPLAVVFWCPSNGEL